MHFAYWDLKTHRGGAEAGKGFGVVVVRSKPLGTKRFWEALPLKTWEFERDDRLVQAEKGANRSKRGALWQMVLSPRLHGCTTAGGSRPKR